MTEVEPATRSTIVVSGLASDAHTWNLVYLQLLLEELGYDVVNLGPCVPADLLVSEVLKHRPRLLVLSSVNGHGCQDGLRAIAKLRAEPQLSQLPTVIGGKLGVNGGEGGQEAELLAGAGFDAVFPEGGRELEGFRSYVRSICAAELS